MIPAPEHLDKFDALLEVVKALRSQEGCPWDKEQTHHSLTPFAIEEAFELADAIEQGDRNEVVSELGDLLLQVALHSEIARASTDPKMQFTITDVIRSINEKMVRRHPHVFALESAQDADEVLQNWAEIKRKEKEGKKKEGKKKEEGFGIPPNLPALMRSQKIGSKTKSANFDWKTPREVIEKIEEELSEVKEALTAFEKNPDLKLPLENELGDLLFCCAQLARHLKSDAEQALRVANLRFEKRFFKMFELAKTEPGKEPKPSQEQLEELWKEVKKLEKQGLLSL